MRRLLQCAAAAVIAGCATSDSTGLDDTLVPGTVSFDFTGAGQAASRKFDATGNVSITHPEWGTTPLDAAQINSSLPLKTLIAGGTPIAPTTWNQILLTLNRIS